MNKNVDVLVDSATGSSGKGGICAKIAGDYTCLVRCGGANAGHSVITPDGRKVVFHMLPSASLHNLTADIVLGPAAIIHPQHFLEEIGKTGVNPGRISIDPQAIIVTEADIEFEKKHWALLGSTCQGVGAATINKLMRTAHKEPLLAKDCPALAQFIKPALEVYALHENGMTLCEGTQGSLLSLHHGFYPYVTTRDTCASGQLSDAGLPPTRVRKVFMVTRSMPIRVKNPGMEDIGQDGGYSGPMAQETTWEEVSKRSGIPLETLLKNELTSTTKRLRRVGEFSDAEFVKACELNGPTDICLTFGDYIAPRGDKKIADFVEHLERISGAPVTMISHGFGTEHIEYTGHTFETVAELRS